jgi:hypothetical protein
MTSRFFTASVFATALLAGFGQAPALAQNTNTPAIDRAQQAISARIQQGMASGHITPSEARELLRRDRDIDQRESRYRADGNVSPQERQQLRADLDALAAEVERKMNNSEFNARPGNTNGIDNRQANLSQRIDEGIRMGRISQREASRLQRRERDIARHEASFKSDGVVTQQERRQLRDEINQLSNELDRMLRSDRRG